MDTSGRFYRSGTNFRTFQVPKTDFGLKMNARILRLRKGVHLSQVSRIKKYPNFSPLYLTIIQIDRKMFQIKASQKRLKSFECKNA